jgi:hypothetical protein
LFNTLAKPKKRYLVVKANEISVAENCEVAGKSTDKCFPLLVMILELFEQLLS